MRVCLISQFLQVAYIKILTLNVYDLVIYISVNSFSEATYMLTDIYINTGSRFGQELGLKKKIKSIIFWLIAGSYRQIIHNSSPFFSICKQYTLIIYFSLGFEWRRGEQQLRGAYKLIFAGDLKFDIYIYILCSKKKANSIFSLIRVRVRARLISSENVEESSYW